MEYDIKDSWGKKRLRASAVFEHRSLSVCACRAFATVESVESMYALTRGLSVTPLSIQQTLDCSYTYGGILYSCYGGDTCSAFDWMNVVCVNDLLAALIMAPRHNFIHSSTEFYVHKLTFFNSVCNFVIKCKIVHDLMDCCIGRLTWNLIC